MAVTEKTQNDRYYYEDIWLEDIEEIQTNRKPSGTTYTGFYQRDAEEEDWLEFEIVEIGGMLAVSDSLTTQVIRPDQLVNWVLTH